MYLCRYQIIVIILTWRRHMTIRISSTLARVIRDMWSEITPIKLPPHLPGISELNPIKSRCLTVKRGHEYPWYPLPPQCPSQKYFICIIHSAEPHVISTNIFRFLFSRQHSMPSLIYVSLLMYPSLHKSYISCRKSCIWQVFGLECYGPVNRHQFFRNIGS